MKATRKLIPTLALLLVSALLLSTASFAWFAMNRTVTTDGLEVTAKSNAMFLLIGGSEDIATEKDGLDDSFTAVYQDTLTNANKQVFPVAYNSTGAALTYGTGDEAKEIAAGNWYTANNGNRENAINDIKNVKDLGANINGEYVLTYKVWLTLSADSEDFTGNIKVAYATHTGNVATNVIVKIGSEMLVLNNKDDVATTDVEGGISITKESAVEVTILVYIDGTATDVYTDFITGDGAQTITGTAGLSFDLVDLDA